MNQTHVALVAPPWYPVPPRGYGGIELIVHLLARGLRERGWRVSLLGAEGSEHVAIVSAPTAWNHDLGHPRRERLRELEYAARVTRTLGELNPVDVIHDHVGYSSLLGACVAGVAPVVHTVHGPVGQEDSDGKFLAELGDRVNLVAISNHQRCTVPSLHWVDTVYNAVDAAGLVAIDAAEKEPYLVCLARICADKGQHIAIEVAERLGMPLVLAGKVENTTAGRRYFEEQVQPHVDGDRVRHLSNVRGKHKQALLSRAHALLAPIQWDEPFGLSVVEAMVSGTPAVSMRRGAAPELIVEGVSGFLVDDVDGMVAAVARAGEIDPRACADIARDRFGGRAMVEGYIHVYEQALGRTPLAERKEAQAASAGDTADAGELAVMHGRGSTVTQRVGAVSRGYT
jgi:glycosyltransferase involved in cell wall biosynthesis